MEKMLIKIPGMKVIEANVLRNGTCQLILEPIKERELTTEELFVCFEVSKLRLDDEFLKHEPRTEKEKLFKERLISIIKEGINDFWHPICDPSFNGDVSGICYIPGRKPAVGMSYEWWRRTAKKFDPMHNSRLGTPKEYIAFCGVLIKMLVKDGWYVHEAWYDVCENSVELGHYLNSPNSINDFEPTGSREICGLFDLSNTSKLFEDEDNVFWKASGRGGSVRCALATIELDVEQKSKNMATGWIICEKNPMKQ